MSVQGMHILIPFSSTSILLLGHALTQELWSTTKLSETQARCERRSADGYCSSHDNTQCHRRAALVESHWRTCFPWQMLFLLKQRQREQFKPRVWVLRRAVILRVPEWSVNKSIICKQWCMASCHQHAVLAVLQRLWLSERIWKYRKHKEVHACLLARVLQTYVDISWRRRLHRCIWPGGCVPVGRWWGCRRMAVDTGSHTPRCHWSWYRPADKGGAKKLVYLLKSL